MQVREGRVNLELPDLCSAVPMPAFDNAARVVNILYNREGQDNLGKTRLFYSELRRRFVCNHVVPKIPDKGIGMKVRKSLRQSRFEETGVVLSEGGREKCFH